MKTTGSILVILAGLCWGVIGLFSNGLKEAGFSPLQITAIRCIITGTGMFFYLFLTNRKLLKINCKDMWMFLGTGLVSIVFFNICYFAAIPMIGLSVSAILLYTAPCIVMVLSALLFKEKITSRKIVALVLSFAGCVLTTGVFGSSVKLPFLGVLAGLGSGFGYALYSIFGRVALRKYNTLTVTAYTFIVAGIFLLPLCDLPEIAGKMTDSPKILFYGIAIALLATLTPFLLYTKGLAKMEAGKASILAFVEPMVACLIGIFVFGDPVSFQSILGILLIFVGTLFCQDFIRNKRKNC